MRIRNSRCVRRPGSGLRRAGFPYHVDDLSADEPFLQTINGQPFATVPYTVHLNDLDSYDFAGFSPASYEQQMIDEFDQLYAEGATRRGRRPGHAPGPRPSALDKLAEQTGELDYLVSLAAAHANGPVTTRHRDAVIRAFDAKVIGPILLAKHLAARLRPGGAILLFSGITAWRPEPGLAVMATTNGAVDFLAPALAVELAPVRVNALAPGIVDSGA